MEGDLNMSLEDVFSFVDPTPLATASIAQVSAAGMDEWLQCRQPMLAA